ncbi:MAG: hypothetical protein QOJ70_3632 [Acidobacteriota bacterium]|jgi:hypothetical protein|nr:hypothetical protein [Acidobacteriota bacterium]
MTILLYALIVFAAFHFIYEGIIAPSLRFNLRFKLFGLRDDLRRLKVVEGDEFSDEVFNVMQGVINNTITLLHRTNLDLIVRAEIDLQENAALRKRVQKRRELLDACPLEEVQRIRKEAGAAMFRAVVINSGGWFVYIVPFFVLLGCASRVQAFVKAALTLPEYEVSRLTVADELVAV